MSRRKKPRMLSFTSGPPTREHVHTKFPTLKPYITLPTAHEFPRCPKGPRRRGGGCRIVKAEEAPHAVFHLRTSYPGACSHEVPNPETLNPISRYQTRTSSPAVPKGPRGKGGCGNVKAEEAPHAVFYLRTSYPGACSHEVPNPKTLNPKLLYLPRERSHAVTKGPRRKGGGEEMSRRKKPRMLSFTSGPPTPEHVHTKFPTLKP